MTHPHLFEQRLATVWPPADWKDLSVTIAVSGGADSVALLRAANAIKQPGAGRLYAAHFNHRLRGAESDGDEAFIVELCRKLDVSCHLGSAGGPALQSGGEGLEAAARQARYEFLQSTAEQLGTRYVVAAHTADDQAETLLQRIVRGTGLAGLAGIRRARPLGSAVTLLRPMLEVRRAEVRDYLAALGQNWREDASNLETRFQRNRIRHELLPLLERDYNRGVVDALLRLARLAADAQQVIDKEVSLLAALAVEFDSAEEVVVDCGALAPRARHLVREVLLGLWTLHAWPLQSMGYVEWQLLAEMVFASELPAGGAKQILPGNIEAHRLGNRLSLKKLSHEPRA